MRCPYCRTSLTELAPECPGCRLNLSRAAAILGAVPRVEAGVSDHTQALTSGERKRLRRRIAKLERRFPQLRIQILCHNFPTEHPFSLYAFWIFNLGDIATSAEKAGNNHTILLTLDPIEQNSAITVGYGLEPFLGDAAMSQLLEQADPHWKEEAWSEGIELVLEGMDSLLESAVQATASAFDLPATTGQSESGEF